MAGPTPNRVGTDDLYDRFGPEPLEERTAAYREEIRFAIDNPTRARGWTGVLIPAVATAIAISVVQRWL